MAAAIELYATRLRQRGVRLEVHPSKTSLEAYLTAPPQGTTRVLLDEGGEAPDSLAFAETVRQWTLASEDVHLMVGPPDGWNGAESNAPRLSLSPLTMPHELASVVRRVDDEQPSAGAFYDERRDRQGFGSKRGFTRNDFRCH